MKCDVTIKNRIKRAHGQMQGVLHLMEKEATCKDILTQLKAVKASVEATMALLTAHNLIQTIQEEHDINITGMEDALDLMVKGAK